MNFHISATGNRRLTAGELLATLLLFYVFLSFPFVIRNLAPSIYSVGLFFILAVNLIWFVLVDHRCAGIGADRQRVFNGLSGLFLVLYASYWVVLLIATFLNLSALTAEVMTKALMYKLFVCLIAIFMYMKFDVLAFRKIIVLYVDIIVLCALAALALEGLIYFELIHPSFEFTLDSGLNRQFYWLGLVWPDTWIGSLFNLARLQSFADEPGTFGFVLIPAILFSIQNGNYRAVSILALALFFTFSVGAILAIIMCIAMASYLNTKKRDRWKWILLMACCLLIVFSVYIFVDSSSFGFLSTYLSSKYGDETDKTSLGDRLNGFEGLVPYLTDRPFGLGVGALDVIGSGVAIGWVIPLVEGGVIAFSLYLAAFAVLCVMAVNILSKHKSLAPYSYIILTLMFAAMQRGSVDSTVWHWFWVLAFIKEYINAKKSSSIGYQRLAHGNMTRLSAPQRIGSTC